MIPYQETPSFCLHQSICFLCQSSIYVPDTYLPNLPSCLQNKAWHLIHSTSSWSISHLACFVVLSRCDLGARVFPIRDLPFKPLALKVMSIVGLVLATVGCCSAAYGKEILNLELLCEGSWEVELNMLDKSGGHEQLFLRFPMAEFENGKKKFQNGSQSRKTCWMK